MPEPSNTYGTTITATYVGKQVERDDAGRPVWPYHAWDVTLTREGESITFPYRMGVGYEQTKCGKPKPSTIRYIARPENTCHHVRCESAGWQPTPPDLYTVLVSLKVDTTGGETFGDWCRSYGYDTDSRKAMETYLACQESEERSRKFFGSDWAALLEDEEYQ